MTAFKARSIETRLIDEVKTLVKLEKLDSLKKLVAEMRPADVADLIEHLAANERIVIFRLLEPEGRRRRAG